MPPPDGAPRWALCTFPVWFFMLDGIFTPLAARARWRSMAREQVLPLRRRGVIGAVVACFSFGGVLLATRIDRVGEAAALRETLVVFAALIGGWLLGEKVGPVQAGPDGNDCNGCSGDGDGGMSDKTYDPKLKAALEYGPLLAFMVGYWLVKDRTFAVGGVEYSGFIAITAVFVLIFAASILALWKLTGKLSAMQVFSLVVILFMGGLTVWFNDAHFIKMKPTIIYVAFALGLGVGLLQGKSYLRLLMGEVLPMQEEGWMILTRRMAGFFVVLAVANEVVWRNFSDGTWVTFKVVGLTVAMFAFLFTQGRLFERYGIEPANKD